MSKRAVKLLIIELREIQGKSFQEISDILLREYSIKMSRQAVCGMYKRAIDSSFIEHNKELVLASNDILNYHTIGKGVQTIKEILLRDGHKISSNTISSVIADNSDYISEIKKDNLNKVKLAIINGSRYDVIVNQLSYKGEKPADYIVKELFKSATNSLIDDRAADILAKVYTIKEDKPLLKDIINNYKMNVSYCKISRYFN